MSRTNSNTKAIEPLNWFSYYSWDDLDYVTTYANEMTVTFGTYITAIRVTKENCHSKAHVIGEWILSSKYDPRIVLQAKKEAIAAEVRAEWK